MAYDAVIAAITLAGSALSTLATACVLVCFVVYSKNQRSLRHFLVLNLTFSDFVNSATNTISGSIYMRDHALYAGRACTFNGWIEQLSVQATDFSILAISVATLLVVRQKARLVHMSTLRTVLICASAWFIPLITATTATAMGEMKPVSGNWCWISKTRTDLRYGLTHGWRFAIIAITIGIYSYIWWYVSKHFKSLGGLYGSGKSGRLRSLGFGSQKSAVNQDIENNPSTGPSDGTENNPQEPVITFRVDVNRQFRVNTSESAESQESLVDIDDDDIDRDLYAHEMMSPTRAAAAIENARNMPPHNQQLGHHASIAATKPAPYPQTQPMGNETTASATAMSYLRNKTRQTERDVKRMLMMNGYPILYVILWIPGLTNRILEASGSNTTNRVLAVLQCSTQYIGFANSVTYGLSGIWRKGR